MKPLTLKSVEKSIGTDQVIQIEEMHIESGSIHVLVGNNGAGKTTLFHLIAGMVGSDSGTIQRFDGVEEKELWKQKLSYMPQEIGPQSFFSLKEIANLESLAYKGWNQVLFKRLVETFELPLNKKLDTFSVGMKKKAMTALALARPSKLLLMDEPLAGVDISGQEQLKKEWILYLEQDEERTILFSTHTPSEVGEMADYIHFLKNGSVDEPYEKDQLTESYAYVWVEHAPGLSSLPGVIHIQTTGKTSMLISEDRLSTEQALLEKRYEIQQIQSVGITDILRTKLEEK
ncbi:ATP-binding cassette domain-containing protein [Alkalicoccobacillus murimartini]|uniref:ABC-2 type transport system ATP-binding protein n=1 Tax=Alkalicoccobacillus murimartini TaxID=171685 RepID=A0ABT9YHC7_9BACI|nr:ABC transporter ATP-binding protein [Alkalicoccobacillus murimartini]MDQ0207099.1 ABC-2 type transport system ATP-binding protein [Alkalicoccobacillus murimartini]